jgi:hypothetical protein
MAAVDLSKDEGEDAHKPHDKEQAPAGDAADGKHWSCQAILLAMTAQQLTRRYLQQHR